MSQENRSSDAEPGVDYKEELDKLFEAWGRPVEGDERQYPARPSFWAWPDDYHDVAALVLEVARTVPGMDWLVKDLNTFKVYATCVFLTHRQDYEFRHNVTYAKLYGKDPIPALTTAIRVARVLSGPAALI